MHRFVIFCGIVCLMAAPAALAQRIEDEHIETDRDSFTPAVTTVATRQVGSRRRLFIHRQQWCARDS